MLYTSRPRPELVSWTGDNFEEVQDFLYSTVTDNGDGTLTVQVEDYLTFTIETGQIMNAAGFVVDPGQVAAQFQEVPGPGIRYVFEG